MWSRNKSTRASCSSVFSFRFAFTGGPSTRGGRRRFPAGSSAARTGAGKSKMASGAKLLEGRESSGICGRDQGDAALEEFLFDDVHAA